MASVGFDAKAWGVFGKVNGKWRIVETSSAGEWAVYATKQAAVDAWGGSDYKIHRINIRFVPKARGKRERSRL